MRSNTWTELLMWQEWRRRQWNRPSRSDHYLMQIAMQVRRVLAKHPKKIKLEHFKVPFKFKRVATVTPKGNTAYKTEVSKSVWASRFGGVVVRKRKKDVSRT